MSFAVPADAYDRFMGRYSTRLSAQLADLAGVRSGQRVLDVGCGPGALTAELVGRVGAPAVSAVDPSEPFVTAARERHPEVDVRQAGAESLPFEGASFDAALAQLVVQFMADPAAGVAEMRRVTKPGGVVTACVWDHGGGGGPLSPFWEAARDLDGGSDGESHGVGASAGDLARLFESAGLSAVEETGLSVAVTHPSFEEWWEPYELGVGPAGSYVAALEPERRAALREHCRSRLPDPPFAVTARAWAARGVA
ncbi:MAG TPA: methyltransferase domain-containing protein [Gaiellaceae bacterium]|nr:methyltransferase domain-containing protein [Gaiellaceae bacterium]